MPYQMIFIQDEILKKSDTDKKLRDALEWSIPL